MEHAGPSVTEKYLKRAIKAVVALTVTAAAYLVGILSGDQDLGDLTFVQWLGLVIFMGGAYGITYSVKNKDYILDPEME